MTEWKTYRAEDYCLTVTDGTHDSPKPQADGRYLITSKHLKPSGIDFSSANKICEEDYQKIIQRSKVEQYDILFSMIGTVGNIHRVTIPIVDFAVKNMGIFKMGGDANKSLWMYYWLQSPIAKEYIQSRITGSTQGYLTLGNLRDFPVCVPPLEEQRRIAGILGAIDDKIENNRRINTNLELQAQALYKQWFVDFEFPNEEGKPYKSSGGKMVDSELGLIPEGWSVKRLDDYTVIKRGGSPRPIQNYLSNTGLNWLKISDATSTNSPFILEIKEFIKEEGLSKTVFLKKGNLVLSNSATPCIPKFLGLDTCIHDGWLYFPNAKLSKEYLYLLFKNNRQEILSQGNGSVFLNLKTDILKSHLICLPNCIEKMNCFNMIVKAIFKNIENCSFEIKRLTTLRDTLLPKLMNGEIKL